MVVINGRLLCSLLIVLIDRRGSLSRRDIFFYATFISWNGSFFMESLWSSTGRLCSQGWSHKMLIGVSPLSWAPGSWTVDGFFILVRALLAGRCRWLPVSCNFPFLFLLSDPGSGSVCFIVWWVSPLLVSLSVVNVSSLLVIAKLESWICVVAGKMSCSCCLRLASDILRFPMRVPNSSSNEAFLKWSS